MRKSVARQIVDAEQRRLDHANTLIRLFPNAEDSDRHGDERIRICKRLRRVEGQLHRLAERYCDDVTLDTDWMEAEGERLIKLANRILGNAGPDALPVIWNRDPRGYSLKIDTQVLNAQGAEGMREDVRASGIQTDWGGYGILAPEIN